MTSWVREGILARSSRPGYPAKDVSVELVDEWIRRSNTLGIRGIICLLSEDQLRYYAGLPSGLLDYYRLHGFEVESVPIADPAHDQRGWQQLAEGLGEIYRAFQRLPKPVLIHCSAGIDRTGRAVAYVIERLEAARRPA